MTCLGEFKLVIPSLRSKFMLFGVIAYLLFSRELLACSCPLLTYSSLCMVLETKPLPLIPTPVLHNLYNSSLWFKAPVQTALMLLSLQGNQQRSKGHSVPEQAISRGYGIKTCDRTKPGCFLKICYCSYVLVITLWGLGDSSMAKFSQKLKSKVLCQATPLVGGRVNWK